LKSWASRENTSGVGGWRVGAVYPPWYVSAGYRATIISDVAGYGEYMLRDIGIDWNYRCNVTQMKAMARLMASTVPIR